MTGAPLAARPFVMRPELAELSRRWICAMQRGDFEAAWRETDRIELPRRARLTASACVAAPEHLVWDGEPFAERAVCVHCDHGLGDTLQFVRYVPLLRRIARSVVVQAQEPLVPLLRLAPDFGDVDPTKDFAAAEHVEVEVMELAYAFRSTIETLPWVLLKYDADWRWMRGRGDSPWYPTMRLFRQTAPGDWSAAVAAVAAELAATARSRPCRSPGEPAPTRHPSRAR